MIKNRDLLLFCMMFAIKCIENLYIFNTMLYLLFVENDNACLLKVLSIINLCLIKS